MKRVNVSLRFAVLPLLFILLLSPRVWADIYSGEVMEYVNKEKGLLGESVSKIMADASGRVWIATDDGVCLYNGMKITAFPIPGDGENHNYTYDLTIHGSKAIYAATGQGVFRMRPEDNGFSRVFPSIKRAETVLSAKGQLFVGNRDGLHICRDGQVRTITVGSTPLGIENGVRDIREGTDGGIWFISRYALNRYDVKTAKVKSYNLQPMLPQRAALSHMAVSGDRFFIGTKNNGLYVFTPKTNEMTKVEGVGNIVTSLYNAPQGRITASCDGTGAFLIDSKTGRVIDRYGTRGDKNHRLPTNAVYCFMRDKNGVDWFGFYRYGMAYTYHSGNLFKTYATDGFTTEGLDVRSVLVRGRHKVIGTTDGLYVVDEGNGKVSHFTPEEMGGAHIISTLAYFNGYYYAGSYDAGLHRINASTLTAEPIPGEPLLAYTTIGVLQVNDKENRLWIGTSEGAFVIDAQGRITRYTEDNSRIVSNTISSACFLDNGSGWMGGPGGLCLYTSASGLFEKANFPADFFNKENIREIRQGHGGLFFFNTATTVYYSDWALHSFGELDLPAYLASTGKISFLDDLKGNYWIVTDEGLFCYDYEAGNLFHFGYGEGFKCQLVFGKVVFDGKDTIYVGTSNGLMYVSMKDFRSWQKRSNYTVSLFDVEINGVAMSNGYEKNLNDGTPVMLPWNFVSATLSVKPCLNDYSRQYGRMYEYRIDDEGEWRVVKSGEGISVSGLSLGRHTLQLRLAGVGATMKTYNIKVVPSWAAVAELMLLIVVAGCGVWWYGRRRMLRSIAAQRAAGGAVETNEGAAEISSGGVIFGVSGQSARGDAHKYERVKLDDEECERIVRRMKGLIEKNKMFTNPDLKMSEVADRLHLSSSKLSQVFNLYMKENYYDFINRYRIEEFKRLIAAGEYERYTLTALSEKCGFKKSTFFTSFRKFEGMTPTEYLKKKGIGV